MAKDEFKPAAAAVAAQPAAGSIAEAPAPEVASEPQQPEPKQAEAKGRKPKAGGKLLFEVELKHLPAYVVQAASEEDAGRLYFEYHGIIASDHQLRVTPLDSPDDSTAPTLPTQQPKQPG